MRSWIFGRKRPPGTEASSPPPSAPAPRAGITVHAFGAAAALAGAAERPGATLLGRADAGLFAPPLRWAALVLAGGAAGDVLFGPIPVADFAEDVPLLVDGVPVETLPAPRRLPRETLLGAAVTGVTGARVLARTEGRAVLRFGPPPAARWAVEGLRSLAVFRGKLTLIDGEESADVHAGAVALVAGPRATVRVLAGNDAAIAVAFASADVAVRLE